MKKEKKTCKWLYVLSLLALCALFTFIIGALLFELNHEADLYHAYVNTCQMQAERHNYTFLGVRYDYDSPIQECYAANEFGVEMCISISDGTQIKCW